MKKAPTRKQPSFQNFRVGNGRENIWNPSQVHPSSKKQANKNFGQSAFCEDLGVVFDGFQIFFLMSSPVDTA